MDRTTLENIEALVDYFSDVNIKRRFVEKCSKLPDYEKCIVQDILSGVCLSEEPEYEEYLKGEEDKIERLSSTLFELDVQVDNSNSAIHEALVFIEENHPDDSYKAWRSLFSNENVSEALLRKIVSMEVDSGMSSLMLGFGDDLRDLARNKNTPRDSLVKMLDVYDVPLWKAIAKNPNCSAEILEKYLLHKSKKVRELIAFSSQASEDMLLALLDDKEESVRNSVSKNSNLTATVTACLVLLEIKVTAKAYKAMLTESPNYAHIPLTKDNRKHDSVREKYLVDIDPSIEKVSLAKNLRDKIKSARKISSSNKVAPKAEAKKLESEYEENPENWKCIISNEFCSDRLLGKMFVDGRDVLLNPIVASRYRQDLSYFRKLLPRGKKDRLAIAKNNTNPTVLSTLASKEWHSNNPNIEVLTAIAINIHTELETLEDIYDEYKIKDVLKNPNCSKKLRKFALAE